MVLGRHLVVTSIDSGDPWLTDRQEAAGWQLRAGIAYSPRLTTTGELLYQFDGLDVPGFDEWYLFETKAADMGQRIKGNPFEPASGPRPGHLMEFVSQCSFSISVGDPDDFLANLFWRQLERTEPESYVADGHDCLTFVTRNSALFDSVYRRLSAARSE